jgi:signal transduction histidine kinase
VQTAVRSALAELRSISAGLWLPALEPLSASEVAQRAVHDYEAKTGRSVSLSIADLPGSAPLPVKIALYRLLQEALMNGFRHAPAAGQSIHIWAEDGQLRAQVADGGPGFDPQAVVARNGHLGLVGMRERVELLGGAFDVVSHPGQGTVVRARLPLSLVEDERG